MKAMTILAYKAGGNDYTVKEGREGEMREERAQSHTEGFGLGDKVNKTEQQLGMCY